MIECVELGRTGGRAGPCSVVVRTGTVWTRVALTAGAVATDPWALATTVEAAAKVGAQAPTTLFKSEQAPGTVGTTSEKGGSAGPTPAIPGVALANAPALPATEEAEAVSACLVDAKGFGWVLSSGAKMEVGLSPGGLGAMVWSTPMWSAVVDAL